MGGWSVGGMGEREKGLGREEEVKGVGEGGETGGGGLT